MSQETAMRKLRGTPVVRSKEPMPAENRMEIIEIVQTNVDKVRAGGAGVRVCGGACGSAAWARLLGKCNLICPAPGVLIFFYVLLDRGRPPRWDRYNGRKKHARVSRFHSRLSM
jgi:hypothetical protein